ncbi:MAG: anti-sigma factor antagonist [Eubacteriales bacterium]|nr:anti-sigma factor antagonist [Methanosarcina sp.]MDD4582611.1 anti-sigma factor antagonist [Eubacteriales bacterium]
MGITFEMIEDILIAVLSGELDHHSSGEIRETIDRTFDTFQAKHLVLSFRGVTFMDSAGVGVVMGRFNKVREKKGRLAVVECSEYINRIFDMAAIYTIAKYFPTSAEAIRALQEQEEEGVLWNTPTK